MENFRKIGTRIFSALISRDFGELPTENDRFRLHLPRWPWWNDGEQMANNQHYGHQDGRPWETPSSVIWKASIFWAQEIAEVPFTERTFRKTWMKRSTWVSSPCCCGKRLNHIESFELYWISHWTSHWMFWISCSFCPQFDRLGGSLVPRDDETPSDGAGGCGFEGNLQNSPTQWRFIAGNIQKHHRKYSWVMFHDHFWFKIGMCSNIQWVTRWTKLGMISTWFSPRFSG